MTKLVIFVIHPSIFCTAYPEGFAGWCWCISPAGNEREAEFCCHSCLLLYYIMVNLRLDYNHFRSRSTPTEAGTVFFLPHFLLPIYSINILGYSPP